jgi:hypothetical protein
VDDQSVLVDHYGGYTIAPFDGNPEDPELWKVAERLE